MKIVIKFAGALLEDDSTIRALAQQVAALARTAIRFWWFTEAGDFYRHVAAHGN